MDPAGIRELFILRHYADNPYQIEPIVRGLPFKTRSYTYYSGIPWLPVFPALTQRVSTHSEGYAGYLQHDALILAGTDLESCTEADVRHMRAAVERGLPLLVAGGAYGLGNSYRLWHDLDAYLPAHVPPVEAVDGRGPVEVVADHPLLRGLPASFGQIHRLHPLEPAPDARVLLAVDGRPVLVAGERGGSRQLMLAVAAAGGRWYDGLATDGFYGHAAYPDLLRQALSWLIGAIPPLRFRSVELPAGYVLTAPGAQQIRVAAEADGDLPNARLRFRLYGIDEGQYCAGGDARRAEVLLEEVRPPAGEQTFTVDDPRPGTCSGLYEVELALEMDDPPSTPPRGSFGMSIAPGWNNWKGSAVDVRRFFVRFPDQRRTRVMVPAWTLALEEGTDWSVQVAGASAAPVLTIRDAAGTVVGRVDGADTPDAQALHWTVPPLAGGEYTARLQAGTEAFTLALQAVALPDADERFPMVAHFNVSDTHRDELVARLHETAAEFGLDTVSLGALHTADQLTDPAADSASLPHAVRRVRWLDALAAARGHFLWTDFDRAFILLATHGATATYAPTVPCVHAPDYAAQARALIGPRLRLQAARAGLLSTEIIDEPHLYPSNLCRCDTCQRRYRERFGEELPDPAALVGDQTLRRWHYFQWLEDYASRAFAMTKKLRDEIAPSVRLHNVPIDRLFTSDFMFNGMHRWAQYADGVFMACYPFGYRVWRGRERLPHHQTHWIAAWVRNLATHYRLPHWGVFMDLWEHDAPNRWMPPFWSVGQFYALLAAGATRMDTFILMFTYEGFGISDVRLREFGREIGKIRPHFPLLAPTRRPRARLAVLHPWCQWVMDPPAKRLPPDHEGYGYYRLSYGAPFDEQYPHDNRRMMAYELFQRAFQDVDSVDEQLMLEAPLDYRALVITDCRFLMRAAMAQLTAYVKRGGVLILDCVPERDESGAVTDFVRALTAAPAEAEGPVVPGQTYRIHRVGQGAVLCFSASLQTSYADAVESGKEGLFARYESAVAGLLNDLGVRPRWETTHGDLDAGLRLAEGVALVPVANLAADPREGLVVLHELPFLPAFAVNLTTGACVELIDVEGSVAFETALDGYHGALVALFPDRPTGCALAVTHPELIPGRALAYEVSLVNELGQPATGRYQVDVTVTDPAGTAHPPLGGPLAVCNGYAHRAIKLPVNAAPGPWTVSALDPVLGLAARAAFTVK